MDFQMSVEKTIREDKDDKRSLVKIIFWFFMLNAAWNTNYISIIIFIHSLYFVWNYQLPNIISFMLRICASYLYYMNFSFLSYGLLLLSLARHWNEDKLLVFFCNFIYIFI